MPNYKGAFECNKCPMSNTPDASRSCPMWWEFLVTPVGASQSELKKMCGYQALPTFLTEIISASNRPAAAIESMRDDTVKAIRNHSLAMAMHLDKGFGNLKALEEKP